MVQADRGRRGVVPPAGWTPVSREDIWRSAWVLVVHRGHERAVASVGTGGRAATRRDRLGVGVWHPILDTLADMQDGKAPYCRQALAKSDAEDAAA